MSPPDLHHVIQTVEDVLPRLLGLDPHLRLMFCGCLEGTGPGHRPQCESSEMVQRVPVAERSCYCPSYPLWVSTGGSWRRALCWRSGCSLSRRSAGTPPEGPGSVRCSGSTDGQQTRVTTLSARAAGLWRVAGWLHNSSAFTSTQRNCLSLLLFYFYNKRRMIGWSLFVLEDYILGNTSVKHYVFSFLSEWSWTCPWAKAAKKC